MTGVKRHPKVQAFRQAVKARLKAARISYLEMFHGFDANDVGDVLKSLGLHKGDHVLVHSSMHRLGGYKGKPSELITVLTDVVGEGGTVLMPMMPFQGSAINYANSRDLFDVRRSPSKMGLLTEMFRRTKGVVISTHPTHPVGARGKLAVELTSDHHLAQSPCGKPSPFQKLFAADGKTALLGVGIGAVTVFHALEEEIASTMPFDPFTQDWFELPTVNMDGETLKVRTRLFEPKASRRRDLGVLQQRLEKSEAWKSKFLGKVPFTVLDVRAVEKCVKELAAENVFCYRGFDGNDDINPS